MSPANVFLIGPGFIGREVLDLLLDEGYKITTLARREAAAVDFAKIGVQTRLGDLDNKDVIADQTSMSDIVVHTATADHLPSVQAVIEGIERRARQGKQTIYIHTSGTAIVGDDAQGDFKSEKVFGDDTPHDIDTVPDSAPHRNVDLETLAAKDRLGSSTKFAIMIPPAIYGTNEKYERLSIQLPTMTRFAIKQRYAGHVGKGLAVWNAIHVFDLARGYLTILRWLEKTDAAKVAENPYFFCENGDEFSWGEAAAMIGKALHDLGNVDSAEPRTVPPEEYQYLFGPRATASVLGTNARVRANRLRGLGWKPLEKSMFESLVEDEIPLILKDETEFSGYGRVVA